MDRFEYLRGKQETAQRDLQAIETKLGNLVNKDQMQLFEVPVPEPWFTRHGIEPAVARELLY